MESDEIESTSVDILHPELLSKEDLTDLLSQKHIKLDHPHATKDDLLEIFHRTITPLPQRQPRANRRGRTTAQVHRTLQAKRKLRGDSDDGSKATLNFGFSKSSRSQQSLGMAPMASSSSGPGTSRLKPPPIVSSKLRTIKLNNSKLSSTSSKQPVSSSSPAAQVKTDNSSPAANSKVNFERKKIVLVKSPVQSRSDSESPKVVSPTSAIGRDPATATVKLCTSTGSGVSPVSDGMQKVSLKSSSSSAGSDTSKKALKRTVPMDVNGKTGSGSSDEKMETSSPEEGQSPKKKIKRIAWP